MDTVFKKSISINTSASNVWKALTDTQAMAAWMLDSEITIHTSWEPGSSISISGDLHGIPFENKGNVLIYEENRLLSYSHLSSLSELPDEKESYTTMEFRLNSEEEKTLLSLTITGFPTETIFRHLQMYWNVTLGEIKKAAESDGE